MKTTKRILATVLAVLMLTMLVCTTAFAAPSTNNNSITITNTNANHTYNVYQIFTGNLYGSTLADIVWGSSVNAAGQAYYTAGASATAGTLKSEADAYAFAKELIESNHLGAPVASGTPTNGTYSVTGLTAGYYLVTDTLAADVSDEAVSLYIIRVVGQVNMQPKADVPSVNKMVSRDGITYDKGISANMSSYVYYELTASLSDSILEYEKYYLRFEDTIPSGLTSTSESDFIGVYVVNGQTDEKMDAQYYTTTYENGKLIVTIPDIHIAVEATTHTATAVMDTIVVRYKATLSHTAGTGLAGGQTNTVTLYYSNDPNEVWTTAPVKQGKTTPSTAVVYTYGITIHKVDSINQNTVLQGATFVMYVNVDGTTQKYLKFDDKGHLEGFVDTIDKATPIVTDANGNVTVTGLRSGTYWIHETVAPSSYNLNKKDASVTITGALDRNSGTLGSFNASHNDGAVSVVANKDTGIATVTITNVVGAALPTTGGIGTTIFYAIGAVLVLGAVVVMLSKKRTNA